MYSSRNRLSLALRSKLSGRAQSGNGIHTVSEDKPFVITTPLFYVNASPHIGSAYPTIAADAIARFKRLEGRSVRFVTGVDEHGEKIAEAAAAAGLEPKALCKKVTEEFKDLWRALGIRYDAFVSTTAPAHEALVREMLGRVWQQGDVYRGQYSGWYCVACEEYKGKRDMDDSHLCLTHQRPCEERSEENYFFRLSKYEALLRELLARTGEAAFVVPPPARQKVLGSLEENGAADFSISRPKVAWGIPVPEDASHTIYVWFDALNGYLTGLLPEGGSMTDLEAAGWPADLHIIGKDIVKFHALYWPAMLQAAGLPPPRKVLAHGFLTKDGMKMGKSLGNTVDVAALAQAYGADAVRFYLLATFHLGADGNFREAGMRDTVNATLANNLGNLLNRMASLLKKFHARTVPFDAADIDPRHHVPLMIASSVKNIRKCYASYQLKSALEEVEVLGDLCNGLAMEVEPWHALKSEDPDTAAKGSQCVVICLEAMRIMAVLMAPVTPAFSAAVLKQLGFDEEYVAALRWEHTAWGGLPKGQVIPKPKPVFQRIQDDMQWVTSQPQEAGAAGK